MIPDEQLASIASETRVDHRTKVLKGRRMFYLLDYGLLCTEHVS